MCKPFTGNEDPIHGAVCEITSAMSALNMAPRPKAPEEQTEFEKQRRWLPDVDHWVDHSFDHLHQAVRYLQGQRPEVEVWKEIRWKMGTLAPDSFLQWLDQRTKGACAGIETGERVANPPVKEN